MAQAREPRYVKKTLEWCNKQRKLQGKRPLKKLPRGYMDDPETCPCGKATGLSVLKYEYEIPGVYSWTKKKLPRAVQQFVAAFDAGRLPQYVVDGMRGVKDHWGE